MELQSLPVALRSAADREKHRVSINGHNTCIGDAV